MCDAMGLFMYLNTYHTSEAVENFLCNNDSGAIHFTGNFVADLIL